MATSSASPALFDADFLASLQGLRITARTVRQGGRFAEHRSRDLGSGIEFKDFRPYVPGDDLRAVDWNLYARFGRVFLRLFEELEDLPLYLLPDVSASAGETAGDELPRSRAGLRCALALAAIALNQQDRVGIFPWSDDLATLQRPSSGKNRVFAFAERLAGLTSGGGTNLGASLRSLAGLRLREGLAVVISDFFDPAGIEAVAEALGRVRHRLLLVQLVRANDREPVLEGDLRLVDCEDGSHADVSITDALRERYRAAYDRFDSGLAEFARTRGAGLLKLRVEEPVVPQLAALFEHGRYTA